MYPGFCECSEKVEPDAKDVKWETEGAYRVAESKKKNMVNYDVWFDANAAWAMTEKISAKISSSCPTMP